MSDKFLITQSASHVATCRICGNTGTHMTPTGTYRDVYPVTEDGTYDKNSNTFICWTCYRKNK